MGTKKVLDHYNSAFQARVTRNTLRVCDEIERKMARQTCSPSLPLTDPFPNANYTSGIPTLFRQTKLVLPREIVFMTVQSVTQPDCTNSVPLVKLE